MTACLLYFHRYYRCDKPFTPIKQLVIELLDLLRDPDLSVIVQRIVYAFLIRYQMFLTHLCSNYSAHLQCLGKIVLRLRIR